MICGSILNRENIVFFLKGGYVWSKI